MWNNGAGFAVCVEVARAVPPSVSALKVLTTSLSPNVGVYIRTDRAGWYAQDWSRPFLQIPCNPSPKLPKLCGVENKKPTAVARVPQAQVVLCCYRARCFETCCSLTLIARSCLFTFVILHEEQGSAGGPLLQGTWSFCIMIKGASLQRVGLVVNLHKRVSFCISLVCSGKNRKENEMRRTKKDAFFFFFLYLFLLPLLVLIILNSHASQPCCRYSVVGMVVTVFCWVGVDGCPVRAVTFGEIWMWFSPKPIYYWFIFFKEASKILLFDWNWQSVMQSVTCESLLRAARNQCYMKFSYLDFNIESQIHVFRTF